MRPSKEPSSRTTVVATSLCAGSALLCAISSLTACGSEHGRGAATPDTSTDGAAGSGGKSASTDAGGVDHAGAAGAGGTKGTGGAASPSSGGSTSSTGGAMGTGGATGSAGSGGAPAKGVSIVPPQVSVAAAATQQFTCSVDGASSAKCNWSVTETGGGSISSAGIYTAPGAGGVYHVVATSAANASEKATALVTVTPPSVANCSALSGPGVWENVTPKDVLAGFGQGQDWGTYAFVVDPINSGTVVLGTLRQGMWRTTDCGATWTKIGGGRNANVFDDAVEWTFAIDPTDPKVMYTNTGYGSKGNGGFKSTNGGTDWDAIWPPPHQPDLANVVQYNFANVYAIDPSDHLHILLTFHAECTAPYAKTCFAETTDGGDTWSIVNGDPSWTGTEGQVVYFLENRNTWLFGSQSNDFWRTEDGGKTWMKIAPVIREAHPQGASLLRTKDGTFFLAAWDGVSRSTDGKSWSLLPNTGPLAGGLVTDGKTMYLSVDFMGNYGTNLKPYFTSPESPGTTWTQLDSPAMTSGGILAYDASHKLLYSSNFQSGFYRVVVESITSAPTDR